MIFLAQSLAWLRLFSQLANFRLRSLLLAELSKLVFKDSLKLVVSVLVIFQLLQGLFVQQVSHLLFNDALFHYVAENATKISDFVPLLDVAHILFKSWI